MPNVSSTNLPTPSTSTSGSSGSTHPKTVEAYGRKYEKKEVVRNLDGLNPIKKLFYKAFTNGKKVEYTQKEYAARDSKKLRYDPKDKENLRAFFKEKEAKGEVRSVNGHDYWIDYSRGSMIMVPREDMSEIRSILFSDHDGSALKGSDRLKRTALTYLSAFETIEKEFDSINEQRKKDGKPPLAKNYTVNFSLKWDRAYIGFPSKDKPKLNKISIKLGADIWNDIKKIWNKNETENKTTLDERAGAKGEKKHHSKNKHKVGVEDDLDSLRSLPDPQTINPPSDPGPSTSQSIPAASTPPSS